MTTNQTELSLVNECQANHNVLIVAEDNIMDQDAVSLTMFCNDEIVPVTTDKCEYHFRLNKQQVIHLSDFLRRIYEHMK
jgi:Ni2+-binding GTPase involved in maturation of urease and hydrogenase